MRLPNSISLNTSLSSKLPNAVVKYRLNPRKGNFAVSVLFHFFFSRRVIRIREHESTRLNAIQTQHVCRSLLVFKVCQFVTTFNLRFQTLSSSHPSI